MAKLIIFYHFLLLIVCTYFVAYYDFLNATKKNYDFLNATEKDYDFLTLAVQWPNGVCATQKCSIKPPSYFTIHGLWPSRKKPPSPENCSSTYQFPNETEITEEWPGTVEKMEEYWISLGPKKNTSEFWEYEWTKHGTCTKNATNVALTPEEYCNHTVNAYLKYKVDDLVDELAKGSVPIKRGNKYKYATMKSAFKDAFMTLSGQGQYIDLKCGTKNKKTHLREVVIYMNNNYNDYNFSSNGSSCQKAWNITFTG